jgi:palmitoyl-protein thioesterase
LAARAARVGIYTTYAQTHLVQAQYYRDVERLEEYMEVNEFLKNLNGEQKGQDRVEGELTKKEEGGHGLSGLENLVAIIFDADRSSIPIPKGGKNFN